MLTKNRSQFRLTHIFMFQPFFAEFRSNSNPPIVLDFSLKGLLKF